MVLVRSLSTIGLLKVELTLVQILHLDADWELASAERTGGELFAGDGLDMAPISAR